MSGKNSIFSSDLLALIFNGASALGLFENASSGTLTNLYVSLHTADPTTGNQSTSEISYTGYARVAVARTSSGWVITSNSVSPASTIVFPASTGGTGGTAGYFAIGTAASGAGQVLYAGAISPTISVASGVTPELTTSTAVTES